MQRPLQIVAVAAALVASAGMAAAADYGNIQTGTMPSTAKTQMAKPANATMSDIVLSAQQKKTIWKDLSARSGQKAPSSFQASVGADVPKSVTLHKFPSKLASNVPTLTGMRYAKLNDKLVVVRPRDRKVENVIDGASAKS